jgi:hypothetical protein
MRRRDVWKPWRTPVEIIMGIWMQWIINYNIGSCGMQRPKLQLEQGVEMISPS